MKRKQKQLVIQILVSLLLLLVIVASFGYLETFIRGVIDDSSQVQDDLPPITVYVDGELVENEHRLFFNEIGDSFDVVVKYTSSYKVYDKPLTWIAAVDEILVIDDVFGDDLFVSVELTSIGKANDDFLLNVSNTDGSFIFDFMIRTRLKLATDFELPDITFCS